MMQVFMQQPVIESLSSQGDVFDWREFAQKVLDVSEISGTQTLIRKMTPDEQMAMKQKNEFAQQAALGQFAHNNKMQEIGAKGKAQTQTAVTKTLMQAIADALAQSATQEKDSETPAEAAGDTPTIAQ
jgi:hypothetical protein